MKTYQAVSSFALAGLVAAACATLGQGQIVLKYAETPEPAIKKQLKPDAEWKRILSSEQYEILRNAGTEAPFSGRYWNNHEKGTYFCAACGLDLFSSDTKFESGTGWPSFWKPINKNRVILKRDLSHGMDRTEVLCSRCEGHLGHVFDDGPKPTGLRFCMNSAAMTFKKR
jgi:peptide-methionine (R)-S-oxide reductase